MPEYRLENEMHMLNDREQIMKKNKHTCRLFRILECNYKVEIPNPKFGIFMIFLTNQDSFLESQSTIIQPRLLSDLLKKLIWDKGFLTMW